MKTEEEMVHLNREQAEFYDRIQEAEESEAGKGYAENKSANLFTRIWAGLRYRQQDAVRSAGIESLVDQKHEDWFQLKKGGRFLEVGCFSGSRLSFELIDKSSRYQGVELSPKAVSSFNQKIAERGLGDKASALSVDFLEYSPDGPFDLIYAHGVLHHFENPEPMFRRIHKLLKPDGVLVLCEPSAVNLLYRTLRAIYRPFQSDAAWEWPFTSKTVTLFGQYFSMKEGFGWGKWSLLFSLGAGLPVIGSVINPIYRKLLKSEVESGVTKSIWKNSYVTALCSPRPLSGQSTTRE